MTTYTVAESYMSSDNIDTYSRYREKQISYTYVGGMFHTTRRTTCSHS